MYHFIEHMDDIIGELEIICWKGGVGKTLVWRRKLKNLVVNLARRINRTVIGGQDAINAYFAAMAAYPQVFTNTWGNIDISNINQVFVKYMKWSYDAAQTQPQLTDEDLDGVIIDDVTGAYDEINLLPFYPTTSEKAVTFRGCIGSIPASVSGMSTMLVATGTQINQEGIFVPGDAGVAPPVRLLFAKRLFDTITVGGDMVYEFRHTLIY